jgi:hypothetical protein
MVLTQARWLLYQVNPQMSMRLPKVRLRLRAHRKMPKLMRMLKEPRCEGVESNALVHMFCKDILAHLRLRTLHEMERFFL